MIDMSAWRSYGRAVVQSRLRSERGASIVEYALLLALIAVVCLGAVTMVGGSTSANLSESASRLK